MALYLALRDKRLKGGVPSRPNLKIVNTTEHTPIGVALKQIASATSKKQGIHTMFVLCHGYAGENASAGTCADVGGMGLQLGKEDLTHDNVHRWTTIQGKVQNIVVYSCAASNTEAGNEFTEADGRYLMGALAIHTDASVFAADRIQWYGTYKNLAKGRYEFGDWEGNLWHFPPSGAAPTIVDRAPVEFTEVLDGLAT